MTGIEPVTFNGWEGRFAGLPRPLKRAPGLGRGLFVDQIPRRRASVLSAGAPLPCGLSADADEGRAFVGRSLQSIWMASTQRLTCYDVASAIAGEKEIGPLPDPAGNPQVKRHVLSDWLTLHGLDQRSCQRMLDAIAWQADDAAAARARPTVAYEAPDLDAAWAAIVQSMRTLLPGRQGVIDDSFAGTARIVVDRRGKARKALTLDNGPTAYPTILFGYRDGPADPVIMAHEFGHALQIRMSGSRFIPPILREVCAFLGEAALLSHARQGDVTQREWLAHVWRRDDARYFGTFKDRLEAALLQPATPYSYAWNYPIARSLAIRLFERRSQEQLWRVFGGEVSVLALHED